MKTIKIWNDSPSERQLDEIAVAFFPGAVVQLVVRFVFGAGREFGAETRALLADVGNGTASIDYGGAAGVQADAGSEQAAQDYGGADSDAF